MRDLCRRALCRVHMLRYGSERGATAVEYAVMVALIAAVIVIAVLVLGRASSSTFSNLNECLHERTAPTCPQ